MDPTLDNNGKIHIYERYEQENGSDLPFVGKFQISKRIYKFLHLQQHFFYSKCAGYSQRILARRRSTHHIQNPRLRV